MIQEIEDVNIDQPELYGEKILWLKKLLDANLKISNTVVISNELFLQFMQEKTIHENTIDYLHHFIKDKLQNPPNLFIKTSTSKHNLGILDNLLVKTTLNDIKLKLEEIYHSWFANTANAYRITYSVEAADTYPALILQPHYNQVFSLVTRSPKSGLPTNQDDLYIVHNTVEEFKLHHISILENTEATLGFPAKVYFTDDGIESGDMSICSVKPELMTNDAYFTSLNDLFRKGHIDEIQFLSSIKPNMISKIKAYKFTKFNEECVQLNGIPGSQGQAVGELVFTTKESYEGKESCILCTQYFRPDDHWYLENAVGAISNEGGAVSHLAIASRHFAKPAVVGIREMDIDFSNKQIRIGSQYFKEGSHIFVDGYSGAVVLSQLPLTFERQPQYEYSLHYDNLERLDQLLKNFTSDRDVFGNLSVDFQTHLSTLTYRLNQIGFHHAR